MKISKLLPITLALMLGMSGAYAAASDKDSAVYQIQVPAFLDITATAPAAAATVTPNADYTNITVSTISGTFDVISNTDTKDIFFYGTCLAGDDEVPALYSTTTGEGVGAVTDYKLIFTNSQIGEINNVPVDADDIAAVREGSVDPTKSPNAIVLKLGISSQLEEGSYPTKLDAQDNNTVAVSAPVADGKNIKYTIPNCKVKFTCSTGGAAMDSSFSTLDTNGLYQATLYLSDVKQP